MNNVGDGIDALTRPSRESKTAGLISSAVPNLRAYGLVPNSLGGDASNLRQDFKRLREALLDKGQIREWNGLMWAVQPQSNGKRKYKQ
jgi:hypothetical protein